MGYLVPGRDGPGLLPDWESCWDAVAVIAAAAAVTWKLKLTFWKLYLEFSNWILTHMRTLGMLIPGLYTEFRAGLI